MAGMMYNGGNSSEEGDKMLSNIVDRLFPLLSGWNNFEGIIGAVLALLLGLWIGWGWEWKKARRVRPELRRDLWTGRLDRGQPNHVPGCDGYGCCGADAGSDPEHAGGQAVVRPAESQFEQLR